MLAADLPAYFLAPLLVFSLLYLLPKYFIVRKLAVNPSKWTVFFFKAFQLQLPFYPYLSVHFILFFLAYVVLVVFVSVPTTALSSDGDYPRYAYLALCHFSIAPIFALRTTVLTWAGFHFADMLNLHILFCTAGIVFSIMHGYLYLNLWISKDFLSYAMDSNLMIYPCDPRFGIAGVGVVCLMLLTSIGPFKRYLFRMFKIIHLLGFVSLPVILYLHAPVSIVYLLPALSCFLIDACTKIINFATPVNNSVVTQHSGVSRLEVVVAIESFPKPGQWYNVYCKEIGAHPLSLISSNGSTLLFAAGCTNAKLYKTLLKHKITAIDGPYGNSFENVFSSSKVLLIAGGIGITPLLSLLLSSKSENSNATLIVITSNFNLVTAFREEFEELLAVSIKIEIYLTKGDQVDQTWVPVKYGRPNLGELMREKKDHQDMSVAVCGPLSVISEVEQIGRALSDTSGLVRVYSEAFTEIL